MSIKLYHTNCPQCKMVEMQLKKMDIQFEESTNIEDLIKMGFTSAPILQVDDKFIEGAKNIIQFLRTFN